MFFPTSTRPLLLVAFVASFCLLIGATSFGAPVSASHPPIVICGAGPASLFFALRYLQLDLDARVEIYEKRSRPIAASARSANGINSANSGFRAFGFGITGRSKAQLEKVPGLLNAVQSVAEVSSRSQFWFVNHRDLCAQMTNLLLQQHGKRCQIHYECPVEKIHTGENTVSITRSGEVVDMPYSLLIAADGSNSHIRSSLEAMGKVRTHTYHRNVGWKALQLPPQPNLAPGSAFMYGLHGGLQVNSEVPNFGGLLPRFPSQSVLLMFWRRSQESTQRNPFNANTPSAFKSELNQIFPNVTKYPADHVLQQFLDEPNGVEAYMKLNKHALPKRRIAFLGDAAAVMYSTLGQGVASSWERSNLLAETLAATNSSGAESALKEFGNKSRQQSYAITDLNLMAHLREIPFLARTVFPKQIQQIMGQVSNPDIAYTDMLQQHRPLIWLAKIAWRFRRVRPPQKLTL